MDFASNQDMPHRRPTSAGIVVVRYNPEPEFLLLRSYDYWDFPKGLIESGETPFQAARRETREETGIEKLQFPWNEAYMDTPPYGKQGKVARYFLAQTSEEVDHLPISPELGRPEHHEHRWLSYAEARQLLVPRLRAILDWAEQEISFARMSA